MGREGRRRIKPSFPLFSFQIPTFLLTLAPLFFVQLLQYFKRPVKVDYKKIVTFFYVQS